MPELPEVETVRRGLADSMTDRTIARVIQRRPDLRIPFPADFVERLEQRRILAVRRRAKYLVIDLDDGTALIMHLGMSGRFAIAAPNQETDQLGRFYYETPSARNSQIPNDLGPHDHVVFYLDDGTRITYADHRRFGLMTLTGANQDETDHPLLKNTGIEPLSAALTAERLTGLLRGKRTSIKAALLDQRKVAGIGNIYACEALFGAGISPRRSSHTIAGRRAERLVSAIKQILLAAIEAGGSSLRDYAHTDGELGYFQHSFAVYGRAGEACKSPGCTAQVARIVQANRSTFFCSHCQR